MAEQIVVDEVELEAGDLSFEDSLSEEEKITDEVELAKGTNEGYEVPKKFEGKTVEEVAKAYSELESAFGRQGTELGDLRKTADQYIRNQFENLKEDKQPKKDTEFDYSEPEKSVSDLIENHPATKRLDELEKQLALSRFNEKHPGWQDTVKSDDFTTWVSGSDVRRNLYQRGNQYDLGSAHELLSLWGEHKNLVDRASAEEKKAVEKQKETELNAAMGESGATGASSKKRYRRSAIIRMRNEDPARYEAMQDEILKAYAEGRVY